MREGAYRSDAFAAAFAALGALVVASIALTAAHFAGLGHDALPFAAAVVLAAAGAAFGLLAWKGRLPGAVVPCSLVCALAGVVAARHVPCRELLCDSDGPKVRFPSGRFYAALDRQDRHDIEKR